MPLGGFKGGAGLQATAAGLRPVSLVDFARASITFYVPVVCAGLCSGRKLGPTAPCPAPKGIPVRLAVGGTLQHALWRPMPTACMATRQRASALRSISGTPNSDALKVVAVRYSVRKITCSPAVVGRGRVSLLLVRCCAPGRIYDVLVCM